MWRTLTLSVIVTVALATEVSPSPATTDTSMSNDTSSVLGRSKLQILAAQFECYLKIINDPPRTEEGSYCNRTWDGWLCWGDSSPGTAVQRCPGYFIDFDPTEKVTKVCHPDGQWFHHPESHRIWTNYTLCEDFTSDKRKLAVGLYYLAVVGHCLSVVSLIISLIIFSYFKSLSCQRISLHKNMFLSFIFNSIVTIMYLTIAHNPDTNARNPITCKVVAVLIQYTSMSTCLWMLSQGIYLHTLIIVAVFAGEQQLFWYHVLGWGFPVIPAIIYMVARWVYFNDNCWFGAGTQLLYIIHGPYFAALLVNLIFLLNIVRVLITKLKVTHCAESTVYMKAVRATLILIPLLGIQYISWKPEGRISSIVYEFFLNIFIHFQGLVVAIIFCFCNAEVQAALKRKWAQWKYAWGRRRRGETFTTNNPFNYHNSSITENSRITVSLDQPPAPPSGPKDDKVLENEKEQRISNMCSNGEVDMLNKLQTTHI
ncbi:uncharacterized protein V6R79_007396 [Siganus canaliculatus]